MNAIERTYPGSAATQDYWELVRLIESVVEDGGLEQDAAPTELLLWADRLDIAYPPQLTSAKRYAQPAHGDQDQAMLKWRRQAIDWKIERDELREQVEALIIENSKLREQVSNPTASEPRASSATRKIQTLQKLALAMAMKHYRYDPEEKYSHAVAGIVSTTELIGVSVTDDTVRETLKKAAEELPWKKPKADG